MRATTAPLDFSLLSAAFRILPVSPAWPDVQPAVERLRRYQAMKSLYPEFDDDAKLVAQYATQVLLPNRHILANALFAGAIIGRIATAKFGEGLLEGLVLLHQTYGFGESERQAVEDTLEQVAGELARRFPGLTEARQKLAAASALESFDEWSRELSDLAGKVKAAVNFDDAAQAEAMKDAWARRKEYFRDHFPLSAYAPAAVDLLCRAAGIGPDALLADEVEAMTLASWSKVYLDWVMGDKLSADLRAPKWLGVFARVMLGFAEAADLPRRLSEEAPGEFTPTELIGLPVRWGMSAITAGTRHTLIIRPDDGAPPEWKVPSGYGVLLLTVSRATSLLERAGSEPEFLPGLPAIDHVFVDARVDPSFPPRLLEQLARRNPNRAAPGATSFGRGASDVVPSWALRLLPDAPDADALVRTLQAYPVEETDTLPRPFAELWRWGGAGEVYIEAAEANRMAVELQPDGPFVTLTIWSPGRRHLRRLTFADGGLTSREPLVQRRYSLTYDGVTLRAVQTSLAFTVSWLPNLVARLFVRSETLELSARSELGVFGMRFTLSDPRNVLADRLRQGGTTTGSLVLSARVRGQRPVGDATRRPEMSSSAS